MTKDSTNPQTDATSPLLAATQQMADAIRVYYEGLGSMPEPLKEQLTREFAAEIHRAMSASIARRAEQAGN